MTTDDNILAGARAIARDVAGPLGPIALDRVVSRHLGWFALCQQRGLSWSQIATALRNAGAGRETGLPYSLGHLSSVVWRQRQKAANRAAAGGVKKERNHDDQARRRESLFESDNGPARRTAIKPNDTETSERRARSKLHTKVEIPSAGENEARKDSTALRAVMRRVAGLRRTEDG